MQDRLHILEDLNMLYIRQMALSLEVTPPPLECTSCTASQPRFCAALSGWACSKWGEG